MCVCLTRRANTVALALELVMIRVYHTHTPFIYHQQQYHLRVYNSYDPSAGSPTETLLRLLLPLSAPVRASFRRTRLTNCLVQGSPVQGSHWYTQSVVATGGVYKGQGLSQSELSDSPLLGIPRLWERIASPRPKHATNVTALVRAPLLISV